MARELYQYRFGDDVLIEDVEATFVLAMLGVEALHGAAQSRLDAAHALDASLRVCVIEASTPVGRDLNKLFTEYLRHELGDASFSVRRLESRTDPIMAATAA